MFDKPIIQNDLRGIYAEALVSELVGRDWQNVGSAWSGWDLEHTDGTRLEVKNSAARQSWSTPESKTLLARFKIGAPKGHWENGSNWVNSIGRLADAYIFAWHGDETDTADHRDAGQWEFFVVRSDRLPEQSYIGLNPLRRIASSVGASALRSRVEALREEIQSERNAA